MILNMQKGLIEESNQYIINSLNNYLNKNVFEHIIFTTSIFHNKDNQNKNILPDGMFSKHEQQLAIKKPVHAVVFKNKVCSLNQNIIDYLKYNNIEKIELCGINHFNSINQIATTLNNLNIKVSILNQYTHDSKIHNTDEEYITNILSTPNGFFIGDMLYNGYALNKNLDEFPFLKNCQEFSDVTILSCAMIEWLLHSKHDSNDMLNIVNYYYKLFPNHNGKVYTSEFEAWAQNGCRIFRNNNDNIALRFCSPIGFYANKFNDIDDLINYGVLPLQNNYDALMGSRLICYAIYLLKIGANRLNLTKYLKKHFNMDFLIDINLLKNAKQDSSCTNIAYLAILIFTQTSTFFDSIKSALQFDCDNKTLLCTTLTLSAYYYKKIPHQDFINCRKKLPEKFIKLIMEFSDYM